jgi:hypothetical protein
MRFICLMIVTAALTGFSGELARAESCTDYSYEISEANISIILAKEKEFTDRIDNSRDTTAAIKLVDEAISLDDRLSALLKTMNACR